MLTDLINRYLEAERIWQTQFDEDEDKSGDSAERHAYMAAACELIGFQCSSMKEIGDRAAFMLTKDLLIDVIANSANDMGAKDFLASMVAPVDKASNAENGQ